MTVARGLRVYPLRELYSGVGSAVVATVPAASLFFAAYHQARQVLLPSDYEIGQPNNNLSWTETLARYPRLILANVGASILAELASDAVLTPCELIKQRAQMYSGPNKLPDGLNLASIPRWRRWMYTSSSIRAARDLFVPQGNSSVHPPPPVAWTLWRGYVALASRNLPFVALQFPLYEELRGKLAAWQGIQYQDQARLSNPNDIARAGLTSAAAAAVAGGVAAGVSTPLDVSKTRIMLGSHDDGVWKTMVRIAHTEGSSALMRGAGLRASWAALGAGVYLSTYETGRQWLVARRQQRSASVDDTQ